MEAVAPEWERLADRAQADPFRRPGWIEAWHREFGTGRLAVACARERGRLVAVLPLERTRAQVGSPANWHSPVFGPAWESAEGVEWIAAALLAERPRRLRLELVDRDDPLHDAALRYAGDAHYRTLDRSLLRSPYLKLDGDWDECWRRLGSKRRNTLKRRRRRLAEQGELDLEVVAGGAQLGALLEQAFRVEALGWKGERGSAIVSRPETHRFYRRVAEWGASEGTLRLALLRVDGRLVAFDLAYESHGQHRLLKTGFDPDFRACAPGLVLRTMMIQRAYSLGLERYEFLGGDDEYKRDWTELSHDRRRILAFAPTPAGFAERVAFGYGRPVAKALVGRVRR